ncbi:MAG: TlpA family protein disulfide reductase [Dysgonamonadaceae bacterium]|jgi:thiol-disulfide isomerase/thioredoxin|nr:TlpA family protein disulfide reductase [Dysgonamonadaceae bacterium]
MMKTKQWMETAVVVLLLLTGCANNRGVVEYPAFTVRNTDALEIEKAVLSDTATVLYIKAFYTPHQWIKIAPNSFLTDDKGQQYPIRSIRSAEGEGEGEGIELGEEFFLPDSGESEFTMTFPPVAPNAAFVDFSEGDFEGAFKIWGIQLTNKPVKPNLPKGLKAVILDKNAVLPPAEVQLGKARLEGQILDYRSGMPEEVSILVTYPFDSRPVEIACPVDKKGKFSGEIDAFSVHPAIVYWEESEEIRCYIASGKTTSLVLNPSEIGRRASRFADKRPPVGEPAYYGGYLASLSTELANVRPVFSLRNNDYESLMSFLQRIEKKTPEELKAFFLDEYQAKKAILDTLNISPAGKQILQCATDLFYASEIINTTFWVDRAYIISQIPNDRKAIDHYYATREFHLPDNFYDELSVFSLVNDPAIVYVPEAAQYISEWQRKNSQPLFSHALGTDRGTLFDLIKTVGAYSNIGAFEPMEAAEIEQIPTAYRPFVEKKNNELLELIEANKHKTGFTVNDVENLQPAEVFPFIFSKFRGKPILLDVWATWCGPCRTANEELKPVKAELAAGGKDIVYVFVAGENSPLETWKNMIPDLHGEHFRLSEKQWEYMGTKFDMRAVPTYLFIDREGNIKKQQVGYPGIDRMKEEIFQLLGE